MNSSIKSKVGNDSPKTPGGISKSLLTPCRRVGLSRKWGKRGPSPFISPLSSGNPSSADVKVEKETKKRKRCNSEEESDSLHEIERELNSTLKSSSFASSSNTNDTPVRNVTLSKKKSKTLIMEETKESENTDINEDESSVAELTKSDNSETSAINSTIKKSSPLSKLSRTNSKSKLMHKKLANENVAEKESLENINDFNVKDSVSEKTVKETRPNNLTKECVVVIQNKVIKSLKLNKAEQQNVKINNSISQTLFDSDSDDTPLCALSKKENIKTNAVFDNDLTNNKVIKMQNKNTSTTGLKTAKTKNKVAKKLKPIEINTSQNSFEDDDDFESFNKRTILVKKSYDKVIKPSRAKSTGSITQKDVDELKAKIEMKKNLLVAKAMSEDTEELRILIKKWQKGCQEALFELFDLMRKKFPDKKNMDYSEILQTLKIPPDLVGYDVENDCFVTPDDRTIILSSINT
ncbi:MATH and LRR domain-containing protein PFE0570w-like [Zerene cesonia]|uniref:MATH and LRR domain-containing protein PFE0570w-like n=1 Tax=Zerene cesonia TaxID=33412 RepID=UPI0018E56B22|nr:MATH and LRR domain-containing protein PFE0570w-like [Zerene cesonia]